MVRRRRRLGPLLLALALAGVGCAQAPSQPQAGAPPGHPAEARAAVLVEQAREVEPTITPMLQELAQRQNATLVKLDTRLKTRASTARKLRKELAEEPEVALEDIVLNDLVRYTMVVEDQPPGHHVQTIRAVIAALEARGHQLLKLKNYWPRGDNYSGVNLVFVHPTGLRWELQFHTEHSLQTNAGTRAMYERLRAVTTPLAEKQRLFEEMAAAWDEVEIPQGILLPQSLHAQESIIELAPPQ